MRWGKLSRNVASLADAPAPSRDERPVWSADQLRSFLAGVEEDRLHALYHLAITTGLRRGELAGLRWADLDLDKGKITVASNRVTVGYEVVTGTPKSKKSAAPLGLDSETVAVLRAHRRHQLEERMAWGPAWTETGLVFTREDGQGYHPQRLAQILDQRVRAAGLPRLTLHGLRHSYATASLNAGVDLKTVSSRLRHSSVSITGDVYAHVLEHVDQAAADRAATFILGAR